MSYRDYRSSSTLRCAVIGSWARVFWIFTLTTLALLAALLLLPRRAAAIDFFWSFEDLIAGETISGKVEGLLDNATSPATDVIIIDDGPTYNFSLPQSTIAGVFPGFNSWTVAAGVITSFNYLSFDFAPSIVGDFLLLASFPENIGVIGALTSGTQIPTYITRAGEIDFSLVPEPATLLLLGLGLLGLGFVKWRKG